MGCCGGKPVASDEERKPLRSSMDGSSKAQICQTCGSRIDLKAKFCSQCGTSITATKPPDSKVTSKDGGKGGGSPLGQSTTTSQPFWKQQQEERKKKKEEDYKKSLLLQSNVAGSSVVESVIKPSSPELLGAKEDEHTLRQRQKIERKDSAQNLYGLDAELDKKNATKLSPERVGAAVKWLVAVSGITPTGEFPDNLKSGKILCGAVNKIRPGLIRTVNEKPIPMMERANIQAYLDACVKLGLQKHDLFVINDLYDEKYLPAVVQNIYALSDASKLHRWKGPFL
eukprot:TRINITY_DN541_c0_g1_i1.p1 TRINITY_DN541_c0_g1~~TRINITY_DN541_c0_g1_i1.p1  ORF type:complete len:284 (-),score=81.27 TRINITY_DN541_c0_g1_i1:112-963(-)